MNASAQKKLDIVKSRERSAKDILLDLQVEQYMHDEVYHKEISRLSLPNRLRHLTFHFAKYAGQLAEICLTDDRFQRLLTDTFIIAISCSNILNMRVWDEISSSEDDLTKNLIDLGRRIQQVNAIPWDGVVDYSRALSIHTGAMAAACEKLDHLEDFPYRDTIKESVVAIVLATLATAASRDLDICEMMRTRLAQIKMKSSLYGHI